MTVNIKSDPNSFVGLLGIDQKVLLLKSGNDFTRKCIYEDLHSYGHQYSYCRTPSLGFMSGVIVLTNARYDGKLKPLIWTS